MNSKDRVRTAFDHEEPDRVPVTSWYTPEIRKKLEERYLIKNSNTGSFFARDKSLDMELFLGSDVIVLAKGLVTTHYREFEPGKDTYLTEWNLLMKKVPFKSLRGEGYYTDIIGYPLKDKDNLSKFIAPDPEDEDFTKDIRLIEKYGKDYYITGLVGNSIWEGYTYLRGIENALVDLVTDKDYANKVMDIIMNYHITLGKKYVKLGVDSIFIGDDLGSQRALLMAPKLFREMIKPKIAFFISEMKKESKNVKVIYHTDGYIWDIIGDLVEIGLDVLNPFQPEVMDVIEFKKLWGKKLSIWGSISNQQTLPFGSKKDVENEVINRIKYCAPGGGLLIAPTHLLQIDVPLENVETLFNSVKKYGKYPIKL